ncbi:hypothetical protein PMZ80_009715 [Knufia obscura]|uniref:Uncharacterized protein n=1 Tax=Knufia obscura TaxID=1635080 RepID=A0ABR0RBX5_9EURO|nr:hypothetical protein PMZ80_009715 [Knufia obscura]
MVKEIFCRSLAPEILEDKELFDHSLVGLKAVKASLRIIVEEKIKKRRDHECSLMNDNIQKLVECSALSMLKIFKITKQKVQRQNIKTLALTTEQAEEGQGGDTNLATQRQLYEDIIAAIDDAERKVMEKVYEQL